MSGKKRIINTNPSQLEPFDVGKYFEIPQCTDFPVLATSKLSNYSTYVKYIINITGIRAAIDILAKNKENYMDLFKFLLQGFFEELDHDAKRCYEAKMHIKYDSNKKYENEKYPYKLIVCPELEIILAAVMMFPNRIQDLKNNLKNYVEINTIIDQNILNIIKKYRDHININYVFGSIDNSLLSIMLYHNAIYSLEYCLKNLDATPPDEIFQKELLEKLNATSVNPNMFNKAYIPILKELSEIYCKSKTLTSSNIYEQYKSFEETKIVSKKLLDLFETC
uniref:Uncharacterized protein n=1 Tax=viral metagenome TaxID=1070528 RepID=A0A6C0E723_9ZZZZ